MTAIERVEVHEYEFMVDDVSATGIYSPGARVEVPNFAVRIVTDDGLVGEYCPQHGGKAAQLAQARMVAPMLLGRDPFERQSIYEDLKHVLRHVAFLGVAVIDIALWDLAAKAYGVSVRELLGGYRSSIPTYASTYQGDREGGLSSKEQYGDFAETCRDLGYRAFKIHGWRNADAAEEAANVLHVAEPGRIGYDSDARPRLRAVDLRRRCCASAGPATRSGCCGTRIPCVTAAPPSTPIGSSASSSAHRCSSPSRSAASRPERRGSPRRRPTSSGPIRSSTWGSPAPCGSLISRKRLVWMSSSTGVARPTVLVSLLSATPITMRWSWSARKLRTAIPPVYACDYSDQLETVGRDGTVPVPDGAGLGVTYDWDFIKRKTTDVWVYSTKS